MTNNKNNRMKFFSGKELLVLWLALLMSLPASAWVEADERASAQQPEQPVQEAVAAGQLNTEQMSLEQIWAAVDNYRAQGRNRLALSLLNESTPMVGDSASLQSELAVRRADVLLGLGQFRQSQAELDKADISLLSETTEAAAYMIGGQLAVEDERFYEAEEQFLRAADIAAAAGAAGLEISARLNALRTRYDDKNPIGVTRQLDKLDTLINNLPPGDQKARFLISLGDLYQQAVVEFEFESQMTGKAYGSYQAAINSEPSVATEAYANGLTGALYEQAGRYAEATVPTNRALFLAQSVQAKEQLYRWEWQLARLYREQRKSYEAGQAYARSLDALREVKSNYVIGSRKVFRERVAPVYEQYAEVLLRRTAYLDSGPVLNRELIRVIDLLEELKQAELEDYFQNACVAAQSADPAANGGASIATDMSAAIVYPVFLDNRVETIVQIGADYHQFSVKLDERTAERAIRRLRLNLENPSSDNFLEYSQQVYSWLIEPMEDLLEDKQVKTIVGIPGGALRTLPLAALHDGDKFLVEK
ncbi:MAG: CHAT domain-containing protein, partial [Gammaproteobacteria bacterium]